MKTSRTISRLFQCAMLCALMLSPGAILAADKDEETRDKVRKQSSEVLARLYQAKPGARQVIASSRGYATFSRWGLTVGVIGGGMGKGLVVAKPSGKETFMRFVEGKAGLGLGIKKYDLVFVFQNDKALNEFVNKGWEAGGQATAAAKTGVEGKSLEGAVSVSPGVYVYQLTEKGLAAELGIAGTKYYKDKSLN